MDLDGTNVSFTVTLLGAEPRGADPGASSGLWSLCCLCAQPWGLVPVMLARGRERLKQFGSTAWKGNMWQGFHAQKPEGSFRQSSGYLCPAQSEARPAKLGTEERGNE